MDRSMQACMALNEMGQPAIAFRPCKAERCLEPKMSGEGLILGAVHDAHPGPTTVKSSRCLNSEA